MPNHEIKISNGAAHWGYVLLSRGQVAPENIFFSGKLCVAFKPAKLLPPAKQGEDQGSYENRLIKWLDAPFMRPDGEAIKIDVTEDEWQFFRSFLGNKDSKLPGNEYVAELCTAFEVGVK